LGLFFQTDTRKLQAKEKRFQEALEQARGGYALIDLLSDQLDRGSLNVRPIDPGNKKNIASSMALRGIKRFDTDNVINVLVRQSQIDPDSLRPTNEGEDLPELAFLADLGGEPLLFQQLSGAHRAAALRDVTEAMRTHLKTLGEELMAVQAAPAALNPSHGLQLEDAIERQRAFLKSETQWVAAIYFNGAFHHLTDRLTDRPTDTPRTHAQRRLRLSKGQRDRDS
jgi:hypothetical protein